MELSTVEDILFLYNLPSFVTQLTIAYEWWIGADGYFVYIKDHKNGNTAQEAKFVRVNSSARKPVFNWKHNSRPKCALDPHPRFRSNCRFAGQNEKKALTVSVCTNPTTTDEATASRGFLASRTTAWSISVANGGSYLCSAPMFLAKKPAQRDRIYQEKSSRLRHTTDERNCCLVVG